MFKVHRQTNQFDMDDAEDRQAYDEILNNPLCTIVREIKEKLSTKHFNEDGNPTTQEDRLVLLVTWETKELL